MIDRHAGRGSPTFVVEGHPDKFIGLIQRHGIFSRILRARICPCTADNNGTPSMYCPVCGGDGRVYDFQRRLLQADEDSDIKADRGVVHPFRVPIIEPISVERMLPPEQGGIRKYTITGFTDTEIFIEGEFLPYYWNAMRVSYYFDRFTYVREVPAVDPVTRVLTFQAPIADGGYRTGNVMRAAGDIAEVRRLYDAGNGHLYNRDEYSFRGNQIFLKTIAPAPTAQIEAEYFFAPAALVLCADLENREQKEKWTPNLKTGVLRMSFEPWYDVGDGDLITLLTPEFVRDETTRHGETGTDRLYEFDISRADDTILSASGVEYRQGEDWYLRDRRDIVWIGRQPLPGEAISVKYTYHPTYTVFQDGTTPNTLENKQYPKTLMARLWTKTGARELTMQGAG